MDTPKSALAVIATDSAISTSANKYAASLGIRIFFIAVIVIPPGLSFFPSAKIANDGIIHKSLRFRKKNMAAKRLPPAPAAPCAAAYHALVKIEKCPVLWYNISERTACCAVGRDTPGS